MNNRQREISELPREMNNTTRRPSPAPAVRQRGLLRRILYPRPVAWLVATLSPTLADWRALAVPLFWAAVSGALLATAFPPLEWGVVAWFGLAPLLAQLPGRTVKQGAWLGFGFGMVFFALDLLWLLPLRQFNPFAPVGILLMSAILATSPMLFGALAALLPGRGGWWRFLAIPALWTAVEAVRGWTELAFPWMLLGHTQVNRLALIQVCDVTGVAGLSFLIVLANALLAESFHCLRDRPRHVAQPPSAVKPFPPSLLARWASVVALVGLTLAYGQWRLSQRPAAAADGAGRSLRVALIQLGMPQAEKMEASGAPGYFNAPSERAESLQTQAMAAFTRLVLQARGECEAAGASLPDVYVLSETAFTNPYLCVTSQQFDEQTLQHASIPMVDVPRFYSILASQRDSIRAMARAGGAPVFFGADRYVAPPGALPSNRRFYDGRDYNSAFLATPEDGVLLDRPYDKMHLVPFGEYSSYFGFIPGFTNYILGIEDITPGTQPRVFEVGAGDRATRFGSVICFESCFPSLFRLYDRKSVDWMAVITNDAWYGLSSGARRHQTLSVFRAIEMRRPVVRVANTGISCAIDAWGRTLDRLPLAEGVAAERVADVPLRPASWAARHTLYMRAGEWFTALCYVLAGVALFAAKKSAQRKKAL